MTQRSIELTDDAITDLRWQHIKRGEFMALYQELKRLSVLPLPEIDPNSGRIHCTDDDWVKCKHRPTNLRAYFVYDEQQMTVTCILRRTDNTYKMLQIIYHTQKVRNAS